MDLDTAVCLPVGTHQPRSAAFWPSADKRESGQATHLNSGEPRRPGAANTQPAICESALGDLRQFGVLPPAEHSGC